MINERYLSNTQALPTSATFTLDLIPRHLRYVCHAAYCTGRAVVYLNGTPLCRPHTKDRIDRAIHQLQNLIERHDTP